MVGRLGQGEVGEARRLVGGAGQRASRVGAVEHELLVIAAQQPPAVYPLPFHHHVEAFAGAWPAVDDVAADDD